MARVTVEDCIDKVENRFELVLLAGHRARLISSGSPLTVSRDRDKNPVVALREILRVEQEAQRACRRLRLVPHRRVGGIRCIPEDHDAGEPGHDVLEELQSFGAKFRIENRVASHVAAGPRQARD